jgi:hypothetical protein
MAGLSLIRRLWPGERAQMRDYLLGLDRESRALRFGGCVSDAQIADYCERLDWSRALVMGTSFAARCADSVSSRWSTAPRPERRSSPSRWSRDSRTAASAPRYCAAL